MGNDIKVANSMVDDAVEEAKESLNPSEYLQFLQRSIAIFRREAKAIRGQSVHTDFLEGGGCGGG